MKKSQTVTLILLSLITTCSIGVFVGAIVSTNFAVKLPFNTIASGYFANIYFFITGIYAIYVFDTKHEKKRKLTSGQVLEQK
jgi:hypothetical protein